MQQAILITAYTDFHCLKKLLTSFEGKSDIYVHFDKRTCIKDETLQSLYSIPGIMDIEKVYPVNWGGRNHVDAILWLCRRGLKKSPNAKYFHLISGSDMLLENTDYFNSFFESHNGKNFLDYFSLPYYGWSGGGLNRIEFRHSLDRLNIKHEKDYAIYQRYINWQTEKEYKRPLPKFIVYGGSSWWSLTREAVEYIVQNYNWNKWYDYLKDSFVPEEMYVQTLLLNSPLRNTICNNNLRYILWEYKNGNIPAILDEKDIPNIKTSGKIFARKVNSILSEKLINHFEEYRKRN